MATQFQTLRHIVSACAIFEIFASSMVGSSRTGNLNWVIFSYKVIYPIDLRAIPPPSLSRLPWGKITLHL